VKSIIDLESLNIFTNLVILDAREAKTEEKEIVSEFSFLEWVYKKRRARAFVWTGIRGRRRERLVYKAERDGDLV